MPPVAMHAIFLAARILVTANYLSKSAGYWTIGNSHQDVIPVGEVLVSLDDFLQ